MQDFLENDTKAKGGKPRRHPRPRNYHCHLHEYKKSLDARKHQGFSYVFPKKETLNLRDDAELGGAEKLDDVAYFRAVGHLLLNLVDGIED